MSCYWPPRRCPGICNRAAQFVASNTPLNSVKAQTIQKPRKIRLQAQDQERDRTWYKNIEGCKRKACRILGKAKTPHGRYTGRQCAVCSHDCRVTRSRSTFESTVRALLWVSCKSLRFQRLELLAAIQNIFRVSLKCLSLTFGSSLTGNPGEHLITGMCCGPNFLWWDFVRPDRDKAASRVTLCLLSLMLLVKRRQVSVPRQIIPYTHSLECL